MTLCALHFYQLQLISDHLPGNTYLQKYGLNLHSKSFEPSIWQVAPKSTILSDNTFLLCQIIRMFLSLIFTSFFFNVLFFLYRKHVLTCLYDGAALSVTVFISVSPSRLLFSPTTWEDTGCKLCQ